MSSLSTGLTGISDQITMLSAAVHDNEVRGSSSSALSADLNGAGSDKPTVTAGSNSVAIGANSSDGGRSNVVSVGSATQRRQITNVAAGTEETDAVNVGQLTTLSTSVSQSFSRQQIQIDNQQNQISSLGTQLRRTQQQLEETDQMARQGIAAVGAMASVPQLDRDANFGVGLGTSTFRGQKALAFSAQARVSDNLKASISGGFSGGQKVVGAGMLYQWK
ncbi:YadA-like family protein [Burkholderia contaminans]|uniref:YadA-like family protein n=1 Tax=Burkholderia contaminans TaxID=488447 RepID=UPI001FC83C35|nr:YadA-like family protein [Burkholderia contaminans]